MVAFERELETEHSWIFWPQSYGRHVLSFLFFWCSTGALGSTLLGADFLYCIFSASSLNPKLHRGSRGPLRPGVAFLTTTRLQLRPIFNSTGSSNSTSLLLFNSSALHYLQTPTWWYGHASTPPQFLPISGDRDVSFPLSLEWPVWSSSSGNNCHAVHRSLSSSESLWSGTFTLSHIISWAHLPDFLRLLTIGMCHFRYLRNGRCDRHRAEITIMQFRGHSLLVRQSMRV